MKKFKKSIASLTTAVLLTGLTLNFNACTEQSPMSAETKSVTTEQGLKILAFGNAPSLKKTYTKTKWISREHGGKIELEVEFEDGEYEVEVEIELEFLPYALSESAEISLTVDDYQFLGNLDVEFNPHGITFNKPAILNFEIEIQDYYPESSTLDFGDLDIYYDNQETGQWELMPRKSISIEYDEKDHELEIEVEDAKLPHFSRYAIGAE